jgi:aarF domain-containing kinase
MKEVLGLARKHGVSIDSCYASLVISVCVLVGFAKALDPQVNLMDAGGCEEELLALCTSVCWKE